MTAWWPFDGLAITGPGVILRPVRDTDISRLVAAFPDDFDLDPAFPPLPASTAPSDRDLRFVQSIWRHRGCWSIDDWALDFGVWRGDDVIGVQTLEAEKFPADRAIDSASWIARPFRGMGFGIQARELVLAFSFEQLDAVKAITSAIVTNHASLGVSRHLGYRDTEITRHITADGEVDMQHLSLDRDAWAARDGGHRITVSGFEACRPFFQDGGTPPPSDHHRASGHGAGG